MPLAAYVFYLESKFRHEIMRDAYITDMLRFTAFGMVHEKDRPPRYWDTVKPTHDSPKQTTAKDYTEQDVIDMFRGGGKLK